MGQAQRYLFATQDFGLTLSPHRWLAESALSSQECSVLIARSRVEDHTEKLLGNNVKAFDLVICSSFFLLFQFIAKYLLQVRCVHEHSNFRNHAILIKPHVP